MTLQMQVHIILTMQIWMNNEEDIISPFSEDIAT